MRRVALYGAFALLLAATVVSKYQTPPGIGRDTLAQAIVNVLAAQRVQARAESTPDRGVFTLAVRFELPGCNAPVEVVPVRINLQEAPAFDALVGANYTMQFAYLDRVWFAESPWSMRLTWLKHKFLSLFGLGRFVTITTGLLIAAPRGCDTARSIDWSPVWDRQVLRAALTTPKLQQPAS